MPRCNVAERIIIEPIQEKNKIGWVTDRRDEHVDRTNLYHNNSQYSGSDSGGSPLAVASRSRDWMVDQPS